MVSFSTTFTANTDLPFYVIRTTNPSQMYSLTPPTLTIRFGTLIKFRFAIKQRTLKDFEGENFKLPIQNKEISKMKTIVKILVEKLSCKVYCILFTRVGFI